MVCPTSTSYADDDALRLGHGRGRRLRAEQVKARDLIEDVKKVAGGASLMDPRAVARVVERIAPPRSTLSSRHCLPRGASWTSSPRG